MLKRTTLAVPRRRSAPTLLAALLALVAVGAFAGACCKQPAEVKPAVPEADAPARGCRLPAPKLSDDACTTDADCGVSDPCHAEACVAKAKSHPPTAETVCTRIMKCNTADANRCGCHQGRCALIPPG